MSGLPQTLLAHLHSFLVKRRIRKVARGWPVAMAAERPVEPAICVTGFFNETLGIGRGACMTAAMLREAGYQVMCEDLRPLHRKLLSRKPQGLVEEPDVWLIHANPPETCIALLTHDVAAWRHIYRIGYWVWESDLVPTDWLWAAQFLHEIWVPSAFVHDAFNRSFTAAGQPEQVKKLRIMPHPVSVPKAVIVQGTGKVTVLTLFDPRSSLVRKNPDGAVSAWLKAFPHPSDQARLLIKTLSGAEHYPAYRQLISQISARPDIEIICETLDEASTQALIDNSDIILSLHRGEGFGLPLAEAMAAGKTVLATGWSGNMQFMTSQNSLLVPYVLVPADERHNGPEAQWAEPDIAVAARDLKMLVADKALRLKLGDQARVDIRQLKNNWDAALLFGPVNRV